MKMQISPTEAVISTRLYEAIIFDLDGVVTQTARVHFAAWKALFDAYLRERAERENRPFEPFEKEDYLAYVDGKPRYDGVKSFLDSRGMTLPWGDPADSPDAETICGLGNRKNEYFQERLDADGVDVYDSTIQLIQQWKALGKRVAIISASNNCREVLQRAGLNGLFDERVDGLVADELGLRGKPAPDVFIEAARRLGTDIKRTVVVEDATAGVEAGRNGGFGFVIGVDRGDNRSRLRQSGADLVVSDLSEVRLSEETASPDELDHPDGESDWLLIYDQFVPELEMRRESLCALGNGYFTTRGAAPESVDDGTHYPGTYQAGLYNKLPTHMQGRTVAHEDLVNLPNWLCLAFRIEDGPWFSLRDTEILAYRQVLNIREGCLYRHIRFRDGQGRETTLNERRFVHMKHFHLAGLETRLTAENWSGRICIRSAIDGTVVNNGVVRYRGLNNRHLEVLETHAPDDDILFMRARTRQSRIETAQAARTRFFKNGEAISPAGTVRDEDDAICRESELTLEKGETLTVEKIASLFTCRDKAISEAGEEAMRCARRAGSFEALLNQHKTVWETLWERCDISLEASHPATSHRTLLILHLHLFHLLQTASPNSMDLDVGIPARGWTGEAYRGHVFWDDLFIFPYLNLRMPEVTRALLLYRYRRLEEARRLAAQAGLDGALFPWQSGSNGEEETPPYQMELDNGGWSVDNTWLQRHVSASVAYNIWQYFEVTGDIEFMISYGAEMMFEIARFWASLAEYNPELDRYEIHGVMGPDEYQDGYPDAEMPGLSNNAYTNIMAVWCLCRALDLLKKLPEDQRDQLCRIMDLQPAELSAWDHISRRMRLVIQENGIISQFEGYENLEEFPWRDKQGNIDLNKLQELLEQNGRTMNHYKVSKQADVLMLFYLFSSEELADLFRHTGYEFKYETIPTNINYYLHRTAHGSTLSRIAHAWVLSRSNRARSWELFQETLESDISDIQGGTTPEGIHLGAMAGSVDILQRCYTGLVTRGDIIWFNPCLPDSLERMSFCMHYRRASLHVEITHKHLLVSAMPGAADTIKVGLKDKVHTLKPGESRELKLG